jgi:hypothetical protein
VPDQWDDSAATAASSMAASPADSDDASLTAAAAPTESGAPSTSNADEADTDEEANEAEDDADDDEADVGEGENDKDEDVGSAKLTPAEMDAALLRCFLYAVQTRIRDDDLPMDPSTLLTHMEACNLDEDRLDVKRSTHKKMAKFLKELGKLGLAKSKTGGGKQGMCKCELQVMSVSRSSPHLQDVQITKIYLDAVKRRQKEREKQHAKSAIATAEARSAASSSSSSSGGSGKVQVLHRYKPDQKLQRFLFTDPADAKKLWTMAGECVRMQCRR